MDYGRNTCLEAIDYKTGNVAWSHAYPASGGPGLGGPGILTTAGDLLFTGDYAGNLIAFAPKDGTILWHFPTIQSLSNGPERICWTINNIWS